ncbi:GNAT family N-acetyltransferase [Virgisporangium aurantiacum]|uniref:Ribosomal-protein-alanine N-acetyltransferase n=1 Tax=Virgisporangium aurantiacum TaxID=175570 RepID=A0A8J3Z940_9ACTN|nr:GNAT family N-acetyltransferase [Virgisporangium aurantiacum]GIJ57456.1 ribosomal-protein-alanine N-acetyltransferase [Virgisporangium aurantiacum]
MNPVEFSHVLISRVAADQWHALEDDLVIGRGAMSHRPDGLMFVSIDAWHDAAFARLAEVMLAALPRPLHTVVDEADLDLTAQWQRAGFTTRRREWEYAVPTDPHATGLGPPPPDVTVLGLGRAEEAPLRDLDRTIRAEIEAGPGWQDMPAEVIAVPGLDPSKYIVATRSGRYAGLLRVAMMTRRPRIGLIAVRADHRRGGIARALLAHALGALHRVGKDAASAEITESNVAATALFEGIGARRTGSNLELVIR